MLDNSDLRKRITYDVIRHMYSVKISEESSLVSKLKSGQFEPTYESMVKSVINELIREGLILRKGDQIVVPET